MLQCVREDIKKVVDLMNSGDHIPYEHEVTEVISFLEDLVSKANDSGHRFDTLCKERKEEMSKIKELAQKIEREVPGNKAVLVAKELEAFASCKLGQFYCEP